MKKILLFVLMYVVAALQSWAAPSLEKDNSTGIVTITTDGDEDLSDLTFTGTSITWGAPNGIKVVGAINADGFNAIIGGINLNNYVPSTISLDLTQATINADVSSFHEYYQTVTFAPGIDVSQYHYANPNFKYAYCPASETSNYSLYVGDANLTLSDVGINAGDINGTNKIKLTGANAESFYNKLINAGVSPDNIIYELPAYQIDGCKVTIDMPADGSKTLQSVLSDAINYAPSPLCSLIINGPVTEDDIQCDALKGVNTSIIDFSGATFKNSAGVEDNTIISNFDNDNVEYMFFPSGFTTSKLGNIEKTETKNANLKVIGSMTTHANETLPIVYSSNETNEALRNTVGEQTINSKELAVYSFESNNVAAFKTAFSSVEGMNNFDKLSMAGTLGDYDLSSNHSNKTSRVFEQENLHYFDFTGATFDDCTITYTYGEQQQTKTVDSNALYYLSSYNVFTCKLPTGNTEIPPTTFYTNNGGWSSPICEITIPEKNTTLGIPGYSKIGNYALYGNHLTTFTLPSTITEVGSYAFANSPTLTDFEMEALDNNCTFGDHAFATCGQLKHVTLSEKVQNISDYMFYQCLLLESIRIPSTCSTIGNFAFYECYEMHHITIPEGVEKIYSSAFELTGLTDIYVMATKPSTVPKIYSMDPHKYGEKDEESTFTQQRACGYDTYPEWHSGDLKEGTEYGYNDVVSWYQAEMSSEKGLGTGRALAALHYPDEMKPFYEGINVKTYYENMHTAGKISDAEWAAIQAIPGMGDATDWIQYAETSWQDNIQTKISGRDSEGNPFVYLPQAYSLHGADFHNKQLGPDKDGMYYPTYEDYRMRLAAGATGSKNPTSYGAVLSQWGWRQFPLAVSIGDAGYETYDKEYDETWYTMAFPWKMTDEQLFESFNQKLEIVEFVGAEVLPTDDETTEDVVEYSMVFHFDHVAETYYIDNDDVEYLREPDIDPETNTQRTRMINGEERRLWKYTNKSASEDIVTYPENIPSEADFSAEAIVIREQYARYLNIKNIMVKAGHPYMIHPAHGAKPGQPATIYINGVTKVKAAEGQTLAETLRALTVTESVTKTATTDGTFGTPGVYEFKNPVTGGTGAYTFIGNIDDKETNAAGEVTSNGARDMPIPSYFLAVEMPTGPDGKPNPANKNEIYPKYYRKKSGGIGKWSQYSAIIVPEESAINNIEVLRGMTIPAAGTNTAKAAVVFGEWYQVDSHEIQAITTEAREKGLPVQEVKLNVVYNINGQIVRNGTDSIQGLPKGMYIVNGKKYMVK